MPNIINQANGYLSIKDLINGFITAMNNCDTVQLAGCFADDADFTNVAGKRVRGRVAIAATHQPLFQPEQLPGVPSFHGAVIKAEEQFIRVIRPDVAVVDINWLQTGARAPGGELWPVRKGLINAVIVERFGKWLFAVFHNRVI